MKTRSWRILAIAVAIAMAPVAAQAERIEEDPAAGEMALDLLVARPVGLGIFALGSVVYVASLPFTLLGGNPGDAAEALVIEPGKEVFVRCLGCTRPGRKERLRDN